MFSNPVGDRPHDEPCNIHVCAWPCNRSEGESPNTSSHPCIARSQPQYYIPKRALCKFLWCESRSPTSESNAESLAPGHQISMCKTCDRYTTNCDICHAHIEDVLTFVPRGPSFGIVRSRLCEGHYVEGRGSRGGHQCARRWILTCQVLVGEGNPENHCFLTSSSLRFRNAVAALATTGCTNNFVEARLFDLRFGCL